MGILVSNTGNIRLNYLRARAELAVIQGKVYKILYSRTAQRLDEDQRSKALLGIEQMLSSWRSSIPPELLRSDVLFKCFSPMPIHLVMNMHNRYLECLYRIRGVFAFDEAWVGRVCRYLSPAVIELGEDGVDGEVNHSEIPALPGNWTECVQKCRLGLELSAFGRETEFSIWLVTPFTGLDRASTNGTGSTHAVICQALLYCWSTSSSFPSIRSSCRTGT